MHMRRKTLMTTLAAALAMACLAVPAMNGPAAAHAAQNPPAGDKPATEPQVEGEPLGQDPANVYGEFDNGLSYIIRPHSNPPGRVSMFLRIDSGALNELPEQNGIAHFFEHMAFNGSANFPPGKLDEYLASIGMVFGADTNAFTSFDQTVYMLFMPDNKPETLEQAMTVMGDWAHRVELPDEEIEKERAVILEEMVRRDSLSRRMWDRIRKSVMAGTRLEVHDVMGEAELIKTWPREQFVDYYRTNYRPENITLIVVGDVEPEAVVAAARPHLGEWEAQLPARTAEKLGVEPFAEPRAFVFSDPEQVSAEVGMTAIAPFPGAMTTYERFSEELTQGVAQWIVNRRLSDRIKAGNAAYSSARTSASEFVGEFEWIDVDAEGEPDDWNTILDQIVYEVSRANEYGFTERELEMARAELLAGARRAVETESTRDARTVLMSINNALNEGQPPRSAAQTLELTERALAAMTVDALNASFRETFAGHTWNYLVRVPESGNFTKPSPEDVLAAAKAAWNQKTTPPEAVAEVQGLLAELPEPGPVQTTEVAEDLGVTTLEFANGVVMHHKFSDYKKDSVTISLTLPGGRLLETAETKGLSDAANAILQQPATGRLTSTQVRDVMTGKNVGVGGGYGLDALNVRVAGSPADLEDGLQLLHALMTDPKLEESAFSEWRKTTLRDIEQRDKQPMGAIRAAIPEAVFGGDVRLTALSVEDVNRVTPAAAEAWFRETVGQAAIEVAVVGDMPLEEAKALVARYLGSLPERAGTFDALDDLRKLAREPGPWEYTREIETATPMAVVFAGYNSAPATDIDMTRKLNLATRVISDQMVDEIREERGLVYSIGATNSASQTMAELSMMFAASPTDPAKAEELAAAIHETFERFVADGPSEDELLTAKTQIRKQLEKDLQEPSFWLGRLAEIRYRGRSLDEVRALPDVYESFTAEELKAAVGTFAKPELRFSVTVTPQPAAAEVGQ